jgi:signal transduction histidine kinase
MSFEPGRRWRIGLRTKFLGAFALVLAPVALLLWLDFRAGLRREEAGVLRDQMLTAQAVGWQIDEAFDALIGFGWAVANDPGIRTRGPRRLDQELGVLAARVRQVALVAVYDRDGVLLGWGGTGPPARNGPRASIAARPEFRQVMALDAPQISDVLPAERLGAPGLVATVPIRNGEHGPLGVVVVGALTDELARRYEHARLLPGQAILLTDRSGRMAFHTALARLSWEASARLRDAEPVRSALAGISSTHRHFPSALGDDRLAAFVPTPRYRWAVGVTVPRARALAHLRGQFHLRLFALSAILVISLTMAVLFARLLVSPVRRLEIAAAAVGRGELGRRVHLDRGDELGRLGAAFDRMAGQLAGLYEEQGRTLRLHEDFMQAAAHELKTPVSTIRASLHLLGLDPQDRHALRIIDRQARRMSLLVDDLLAVAALTTATRQAPASTVDLARLCQETVRRAADLSERHSFLAGVQGPLVVSADRELIEGVLVRLLENALTATPEGGVIEVTTRSEGREAIATVVDHGPGIAPERQAHIFEPFYEPVPSGHPGYAGVVSLRLHLCRRILEAQGGRIWLTAAPGGGSSFSFALPLAHV